MGNVQKYSNKEGGVGSFPCLHCSRHLSVLEELTFLRGGREGRKIFSLHDHNFFHPDKHEYFHSGVEIVISLVVVVAFWKYTHHYLITLPYVKNHSLHGVKFFSIQIHVIRND